MVGGTIMTFDIVRRTVLCALAGALLLTSCTSSSKKRTPHVYRGGQYYEDAVHR
jgi:hypothetical protein